MCCFPSRTPQNSSAHFYWDFWGFIELSPFTGRAALQENALSCSQSQQPPLNSFSTAFVWCENCELHSELGWPNQSHRHSGMAAWWALWKSTQLAFSELHWVWNVPPPPHAPDRSDYCLTRSKPSLFLLKACRSPEFSTTRRLVFIQNWKCS